MPRFFQLAGVVAGLMLFLDDQYQDRYQD